MSRGREKVSRECELKCGEREIKGEESKCGHTI
jgi:hypothetical protein